MLTLLYFSFWELFAKCEKKKSVFDSPQIMSLTKAFFTIIRGLGIKANKNPSLQNRGKKASKNVSFMLLEYKTRAS